MRSLSQVTDAPAVPLCPLPRGGAGRGMSDGQETDCVTSALRRVASGPRGWAFHEAEPEASPEDYVASNSKQKRGWTQPEGEGTCAEVQGPASPRGLGQQRAAAPLWQSSEHRLRARLLRLLNTY